MKGDYFRYLAECMLGPDDYFSLRSNFAFIMFSKKVSVVLVFVCV